MVVIQIIYFGNLFSIGDMGVWGNAIITASYEPCLGDGW